MNNVTGEVRLLSGSDDEQKLREIMKEAVSEVLDSKIKAKQGRDYPVALLKAMDALNRHYEKALKNPVVRDRVAWALYQVWKETMKDG